MLNEKAHYQRLLQRRNGRFHKVVVAKKHRRLRKCIHHVIIVNHLPHGNLSYGSVNVGRHRSAPACAVIACSPATTVVEMNTDHDLHEIFSPSAFSFIACNFPVHCAVPDDRRRTAVITHF